MSFDRPVILTASTLGGVIMAALLVLVLAGVTIALLPGSSCDEAVDALSANHAPVELRPAFDACSLQAFHRASSAHWRHFSSDGVEEWARAMCADATLDETHLGRDVGGARS